jgi:alpha,alpha-trehalose phosphorylase
MEPGTQVRSPYPVEPWQIREPELSLSRLAQSESVFALSNGHIGLRANLDEGEPYGLPGTYLNSFYELRPLPYAEAGFGYPESGQTVVNVTNGKLIRLMVDDQPLDLRYGQLRRHERILDLRSGLLSRELEWVSPAGSAIRVRSQRLVSFTQRAVAAICYEVEPVDTSVRVVVQSELVANETVPTAEKDPRVSAMLDSPLVAEAHHTYEASAVLTHRTAFSELRMAAAMDHDVDGVDPSHVRAESHPDLARITVGGRLAPGQRLRIVKYLAYGWSSRRSMPALRDQVIAAMNAARFDGWDGLVAQQREYLDAFWDAADVELDGDAEVQQAVRFALFHVLQAGARGEQRPIAAKGLTGPGYDGHVFWDTEQFVLPMLTYIQPKAAGDVVRWRHATLDLARERSQQLGLAGCAFPWRTIRGQECSAYWPAGTAAFHINAAVADAARRYVWATDDRDFEHEVGLEILVDTARLWHALGHHDRTGQFHIDGVTGPDEYSALADDNIYTNLMAARNLVAAADAAARHPERSRQFGVDDEETAAWRDAAEHMHIPFDERLGVHSQAVNFTRYDEWDFAAMTPRDYPLLLSSSYFDLYRKQVVKQADLVLAMHWCGDEFSPAEKARNFGYYEQRTVRDSSLSACTQAIIAAEVGHLDLAHDYIGEAALMDLHDLEHNTRDGVHIASLAGAWLALVAGLGGMRDHGEQLGFAPRLPDRIGRLRFAILWRGLRLQVTADQHEATYQLRDGSATASIRLLHHGEAVFVTTDQPVTLPIPPIAPITPPPTQPPGRTPTRRSPLAG